MDAILGKSETPFHFMECVSHLALSGAKDKDHKTALPAYDLIFVVIPALEVLAPESFAETLKIHKTQMAPCLHPDGPTLVLILSEDEESENFFVERDLDVDQVVEAAAKILIRVCAYFVQENNLNSMKLPLVTSLNILDEQQFRRLINEIGASFQSMVNSKPWNFVSNSRKLRNSIILSQSKEKAKSDQIQQQFRASVIFDDDAAGKRFFQCVRYLSERPFTEDEKDSMCFFARRQKIGELLECASKLEGSQNSDDFIKVKKLLRLLDAPLETRGKSNARILTHKSNIMRIALPICDKKEYDKLQDVFDKSYEPTLEDILSVRNNGITADWCPVEVTLGPHKMPFSFLHYLSEDVQFTSDLPDYDLIVLIIPAMEALSPAAFAETIRGYKSTVAACLDPDGPTLVIILSESEAFEKRCIKEDIDSSDVIDAASGIMLDVSSSFMEFKELTMIKIPLVTSVNFLNQEKLARLMSKVTKCFEVNKSYLDLQCTEDERTFQGLQAYLQTVEAKMCLHPWNWLPSCRIKLERKVLKSFVLTNDDEASKKLFQGLRFLSGRPLDDDEKYNMIFFIRKQMVTTLLKLSKSKSTGGISADCAALSKLLDYLQDTTDSRIESNVKIHKLKREILRVAQYVCNRREYVTSYFNVINKDYEPTFSDMLKVEDSGVTADWCPVEVTLGRSAIPFTFLDPNSEGTDYKSELPSSDLVVLIIPAEEVFSPELFTENLKGHKATMATCLDPDGPTLVVLLSEPEGFEQTCKDNDIEREDIVGNAAKMFVEMSQFFLMESEVDDAMKLPFVISLQITDQKRLKKLLSIICQLFEAKIDTNIKLLKKEVDKMKTYPWNWTPRDKMSKNKRKLQSIVSGHDVDTTIESFQCLRFVSEKPMTAEELENYKFFIRRSKITELLRLLEGKGDPVDEKKLTKLAGKIEAPICSRAQSNKMILKKRDLILKVTLGLFETAPGGLDTPASKKEKFARDRSKSITKRTKSFMKQSSRRLSAMLGFGKGKDSDSDKPIEYRYLSRVFGSDYEPTLSEILSVKNKGTTDEWSPVEVVLGKSGYNFTDCRVHSAVTKSIDLKSELPGYDLVLIVIPATETLSNDSFESALKLHKTQMSACLPLDGPKLVVLLSQTEDFLQDCNDMELDVEEQIESATKTVVQVCSSFLHDSPHQTSMKLPYVISIDMSNPDILRQALIDISKAVLIDAMRRRSSAPLNMSQMVL